jgi:hypothetical protein
VQPSAVSLQLDPGTRCNLYTVAPLSSRKNNSTTNLSLPLPSVLTSVAAGEVQSGGLGSL